MSKETNKSTLGDVLDNIKCKLQLQFFSIGPWSAKTRNASCSAASLPPLWYETTVLKNVNNYWKQTWDRRPKDHESNRIRGNDVTAEFPEFWQIHLQGEQENLPLFEDVNFTLVRVLLRWWAPIGNLHDYIILGDAVLSVPARLHVSRGTLLVNDMNYKGGDWNMTPIEREIKEEIKTGMLTLIGLEN